MRSQRRLACWRPTLPWRHQRAGLADEDFRIGREIEVIGHRDANLDSRGMKAEQDIFDGKT